MPDEVECLPSFDPSYSRPPIIEAVIEIRLLEAVGASDLARVSEQFAPCYPNEQKHSDVDFAITPDASGQPQTERIGSVDWLRRSSQDDREVALLKPGAMAIADRAPYSGWEKFFTRFQRMAKA